MKLIILRRLIQILMNLKRKKYIPLENSLLREKIKELEIYKYIDELSIDEDYLNILIKGRYEN